MTPLMVLILGCTATGKGKAAFNVAQRLGGEVLSVDSMKVYRRMDIGTAKPDPERRQAVPHHLIDVVEPWESFSVGRYVELADGAIAQVQGRGRPIIAVGGTAMYLRALLEGLFDGPPAAPELRRRLKEEASQGGLARLHERLKAVDPAAGERIHPNDAKRIVRALEVHEITGRPISSFQTHFRTGRYRHPWRMFGLRREPADASHRMNQRVKAMIEAGLVEEVKSLLAEPGGISPQARQAVGYAEIIEHLEGRRDLAETVDLIKLNTRRLAKRQRTWFRSFVGVRWVDLLPESTVEGTTETILRELSTTDGAGR